MATVNISFKGALHQVELEGAQATVSALKQAIQSQFDVEPALQKLIYKGRTLLDDDAAPTDSSAKLMLLVTSRMAVAQVNETAQSVARAQAARESRRAGILNKTASGLMETTFRFHRITCLTHLPEPERSLAYLHRLSEDRCIRKLMQQEKYTVGHLTELDPRLYTSHTGKILGLNKNGGQEILLRLRTDPLDGWLDYKGVRATLLHELTHNVHSEHDKHFFALLVKHEKDVKRWETGHVVHDSDVYIPPEGSAACCGTRAETRVLGSSKSGTQGEVTVDAREARAKAAEARAQQREKH